MYDSNPDRLLLVKCHAAAAAAHSLSFLVLLIMLLTGPSSSWPVTIPSYNGARVNWSTTYNIGWVLITFPLLSTLNHTIFASSADYSSSVLRLKTNWVRWAEYSLSAGAMVWVIATLSGVTELRTLLALLVLNMALQYIGFLIEATYASVPQYQAVRNSAATPTTATPNNLTLVGWLVFVAMWIEIGVSFFSAIEYDSVQKPPDMVYAIVIVLFVLFSTFGALQLAYVNHYLITSFIAYEIGFIFLSFVSKTLLTWMVYGGVVNAGRNMQQPN